MRKMISLLVSFAFTVNSILPSLGMAQTFGGVALPEPGNMVSVSPAFEPALIKGLVVHKDNPFLFDFIVDPGQSQLSQETLKDQVDRMIKYFFAALTVPDKDIWVNLSPYEKDRMVPSSLGQTAMGRDLLAQDYLLKQLTASLIYPQSSLGKSFWAAVYAQTQKKFGTTNVPVNTFNKVWIVPQEAGVYEYGQTAFIVNGHLKVMLEEDYLATTKHNAIINLSASKSDTNQLGSKIIRQIVLPEIEKEVNEDKNFSTLRQIFYAQVLAVWFKQNLKQALLNQVYANKNTVKGIDQNPATTNETIYQQYLRAYKKGVFNFIEEDVDPVTQETLPRKYFSGGYGGQVTLNKPSFAQAAAAEAEVEKDGPVDFAVLAAMGPEAATLTKNVNVELKAEEVSTHNPDAAMTVSKRDIDTLIARLQTKWAVWYEEEAKDDQKRTMIPLVMPNDERRAALIELLNEMVEALHLTKTKGKESIIYGEEPFYGIVKESANIPAIIDWLRQRRDSLPQGTLEGSSEPLGATMKFSPLVLGQTIETWATGDLFDGGPAWRLWKVKFEHATKGNVLRFYDADGNQTGQWIEEEQPKEVYIYGPYVIVLGEKGTLQFMNLSLNIYNQHFRNDEHGNLESMGGHLGLFPSSRENEIKTTEAITGEAKSRIVYHKRHFKVNSLSFDNTLKMTVTYEDNQRAVVDLPKILKEAFDLKALPLSQDGTITVPANPLLNAIFDAYSQSTIHPDFVRAALSHSFTSLGIKYYEIGVIDRNDHRGRFWIPQDLKKSSFAYRREGDGLVKVSSGEILPKLQNTLEMSFRRIDLYTNTSEGYVVVQINKEVFVFPVKSKKYDRRVPYIPLLPLIAVTAIGASLLLPIMAHIKESAVNHKIKTTSAELTFSLRSAELENDPQRAADLRKIVTECDNAIKKFSGSKQFTPGVSNVIWSVRQEAGALLNQKPPVAPPNKAQTNDKAALANSVPKPLDFTRGGIDLSEADAAMRVTKDVNGGVEVNVDPALIARIERQGLPEVIPVIINMRPADMRSLFKTQTSI